MLIDNTTIEYYAEKYFAEELFRRDEERKIDVAPLVIFMIQFIPSTGEFK